MQFVLFREIDKKPENSQKRGIVKSYKKEKDENEGRKT